MTRYEEAERLYAEGWTYQQIAEHFHGDEGLSVSALKTRGKRLVNYEEALKAARDWKAQNREKLNAYDRAYDETHKVPCEECGKPHHRASITCRDCVRARRDVAWRTIELMWGDGYSLPEIAAALDRTVSAVGVDMVRMRKAGWNLPYRYNVRDGRRVPA